MYTNRLMQCGGRMTNLKKSMKQFSEKKRKQRKNNLKIQPTLNWQKKS